MIPTLILLCLAQNLTLESLQQMALAGNPTAAQAEANARMATALTRQSGLYPNPTVGYYGDEIRGGSYAGGKQGGYFSQNIVTGGKLQAARKVAQLSAAEAKTAVELQRQRITNNVRLAFYEVLAAQRLLDVRNRLAHVADDAEETARQFANVGQMDRPDILQAQVEQQQAKLSQRIAQQDLESAWRMLAAVVGKPDLPRTELEGDLEAIPEINYNQLLGKTLAESPEIKLASQNIERTQASFAQAKKAPIPDLQLTANLSQDNEPVDLHRAVGLTGGVQIGVQLPIFNHNQGNIAAAKSEAEIAASELTRLKLRLTRDIASQFRAYDSARATVQQYKTEMLPRAEEAYQLYSANYNNMAGIYPRVLMAQRTMFQLEADYVHALEMAWQSAITLESFGLIDGLSLQSR
jgi:cobalt-zinc-cadmium efflux system outer membrane protein